MKDNWIGDEGIKELAVIVSMNNNLQYLNLDHNRIEHIPSIFMKIPELEIWNQEKDVIFKHPPQEIVKQGIEAIKKYYEEYETSLHNNNKSNKHENDLFQDKKRQKKQ